MIFCFPFVEHHAFTLERTAIPLDVIFCRCVSAHDAIVLAVATVPAYWPDPIAIDAPCDLVIELGENQAHATGIVAGAHLRLE